MLGEREGSHHAAVPLGREMEEGGIIRATSSHQTPFPPQHACSLSSTESPPRMNVLRDLLLQLPGAKSREAGSCPRKAVRGDGEPRVLGSSRSSALRLACNLTNCFPSLGLSFPICKRKASDPPQGPSSSSVHCFQCQQPLPGYPQPDCPPPWGLLSWGLPSRDRSLEKDSKRAVGEHLLFQLGPDSTLLCL